MNDQMTERIHPFLRASFAQKEVPIVIAHHHQESKDFQKILTDFQFQEVGTVPELMRALAAGGKYYFSITKETEKVAYDLAAQYPTGQVGLFDTKTMQTLAVTPCYEDLCFVLLVEKPCLFDLREKGMDLLKKAGMAFQS